MKGLCGFCTILVYAQGRIREFTANAVCAPCAAGRRRKASLLVCPVSKGLEIFENRKVREDKQKAHDFAGIVYNKSVAIPDQAQN